MSYVVDDDTWDIVIVQSDHVLTKQERETISERFEKMCRLKIVVLEPPFQFMAVARGKK